MIFRLLASYVLLLLSSTAQAGWPTGDFTTTPAEPSVVGATSDELIFRLAEKGNPAKWAARELARRAYFGEDLKRALGALSALAADTTQHPHPRCAAVRAAGNIDRTGQDARVSAILAQALRYRGAADGWSDDVAYCALLSTEDLAPEGGRRLVAPLVDYLSDGRVQGGFGRDSLSARSQAAALAARLAPESAVPFQRLAQEARPGEPPSFDHLRALTAYSAPLRGTLQVMNTLSTLQLYGPKPGFHHGVDLKSPPGTPVYAPVGGLVGEGYYYPPRQTPYTYMVFIEGDDGLRWEFHHIDQNSIPQKVRELAKCGGRIEKGEHLADIYDASSVGLASHVHIDLIDPSGVRRNALAFFPAGSFSDSQPPVIRGAHLVDETGLSIHPAERKRYQLILDIIDPIWPLPHGDAVAKLRVSAFGQTLASFDFSETLPDKDYLKGVSDIYRVDPVTMPTGAKLANEIDPEKPRTFLYQAELDLTRAPAGASSVIVLIEAQDYAGNTVQATRVFEIR